MKKSTFLAAAMCISVLATAQKKYVVTMKLPALTAPATAYLVASYGWTNQHILDSVENINGLFLFKGEMQEPLGVHMIIIRSGEYIGMYNKNADAKFFYLEPGNIQLQGKDSVKKAVITGSALNAEFKKYQATVLKPVSTAEEQLNKAFQLAIRNNKASTAFNDSMMHLFEIAMRQTDSLKRIYIRQHPQSFLSLVALKELAGDDPDVATLEPLFKQLSLWLRNTQVGKELAKKLYETSLTSIGAVAPDFTQNDVNDQPVKLSDFRGKYVLLDFWASWCGPCRAENPNVVKAYEKYKDKNFTVLGVSLDQPGKKEAWLTAIQKDELPWTQVSDLKFWNNAAAKLYGINAIPQNFLIDPAGRIIAKNLRGEALEQKLAALIK
jgi:peroxiredoxin